MGNTIIAVRLCHHECSDVASGGNQVLNEFEYVEAFEGF